MSRIVPATEYWIREAAKVIKDGGIVAFPTETVYGLGANALDDAAVQRIFDAKGRPATNPLIVHIAEISQIDVVASRIGEYAPMLATKFWPGPLTLVLPKTDAVSKLATAGGSTVGVRIPNHPVALGLIQASGLPIAAPSANRSEEVSPTTAQHVADSMGDAVDLILDGSACGVGIESTVLNLTVHPARILRPGAVSAEAIARVIGVTPGMKVDANLGAPVQSPGQMLRHYAPKTPLTISENAADEARQNPRCVAITHHRVINEPNIRILPATPDEYAQHLYATLREIDALGFERIIVQNVPISSEWNAIRDRLRRAATTPSAR